jgi:hypothetical protein
LIKQVDSNGYAYDLYFGSALIWISAKPPSCAYFRGRWATHTYNKFKSVIKCVLIILNMLAGWALTVIQKRRTDTIKMIDYNFLSVCCHVKREG